MSKGPKTRGSYGPTSPRGIYTKSVRAPGVSLDMPDEPVKKRTGGKIKKMSAGGEPRPQIDYKAMFGPARREAMEAKRGPRMRTGGSVPSASKRADGCATKGKTRGKFV